MVWDRYSPERAKEVTETTAKLALKNYREIVDNHFPGFKQSLPLRVAMPVKLTGTIYRFEGTPDNPFRGSYAWYQSMTPMSGNQDEVDIIIGDRRDHTARCDEWDETKRKLRSLGRLGRVAQNGVSSFREGEAVLGSPHQLMETTLELLHRDLARLFDDKNSSRMFNNSTL